MSAEVVDLSAYRQKRVLAAVKEYENAVALAERYANEGKKLFAKKVADKAETARLFIMRYREGLRFRPQPQRTEPELVSFSYNGSYIIFVDPFDMAPVKTVDTRW